MTHNEIQNSFVEFDAEKRFVIEPAHRQEFVAGKLAQTIETYKPGVVVKAGIGAGSLLLDIAERCERCIAVESSPAIIKRFVAEYGSDKRFHKIQIVNGSFSCMPVDYYKADMLVSVDNLDFILSGLAMEEFSRILQFEGIFFYAGVVLSDEDIEGTYDEYVRLANPVHTDYYLAGDFRTFMELTQFTRLSDEITRFPVDLAAFADYFRDFAAVKNDPAAALGIVDANKELFANLYGLKDRYLASEYYLTATYRKNKFVPTEAKI